MPEVGPAARDLYRDARVLLERIVDGGAGEGIGGRRVLAGQRDRRRYRGLAGCTRAESMATFRTLRQQMDKTDGRPNVALADFVAPVGSGVDDHIGAFAVTAGHGLDGPDGLVAEFVAANDDYSAILAKALTDRLAEAFAEGLHERVRRELWGYAPDEALSNADLIAERYQGIRPAPGYPACPDHTEKRTLFDLLEAEQRAGIRLTESYAMSRGHRCRVLPVEPGQPLLRGRSDRAGPARGLRAPQGDPGRGGRALARPESARTTHDDGDARARFRDRLATGPLLADGAMGTLLYSRGVPQRAVLDELVATRPELIGTIHREYLAAGADIIETATFGANRIRLATAGLGDQAGRLSRRGAQIAREARDVAGRDVLVAGSVGPVGSPGRELLHLDEASVRSAFRETIDGLLEGGVDLFWFETFSHVDHLAIAVSEARAAAVDLPVVALLTFGDDLALSDGTGPAEPRGSWRPAPMSTCSASTAERGRSAASTRSARWVARAAPSCRTPACRSGSRASSSMRRDRATSARWSARCLIAGRASSAGAAGPAPITSPRCGRPSTPGSARIRRRPRRLRHRGRTDTDHPRDPHRDGRDVDDRHRATADRAGSGPGRTPLPDLGRDRPAAVGSDRTHHRGRPPAARCRGRSRQHQRLGHGAREDGGAGGRVRHPARPRSRMRGPCDDARSEPHGPRIRAPRERTPLASATSWR